MENRRQETDRWHWESKSEPLDWYSNTLATTSVNKAFALKFQIFDDLEIIHFIWF